MAQLALQNLDFDHLRTIVPGLSVPSRGSCDPAEWTALLGRWRGVPSTQRGPGSQLPLRVLEMYQIVAAGDDSTPLRSEIKL